ncbi:ATP synthase F1 subunit delta [Mycoplasma nasistruthionis]|uniref:ATP synthase subunit delta n=1 Tax=Mycoplasma nasistruthionis TaxID=353852 RepID=A0A4Y6I5R4_9MOLU|nr:ATP synthase F1 subunit delta [Mycoplasma nasistruthionis]QCZ36671.1 ATP synthase F1 subunit delta [Mycoplasma nasistruthionis]QDF64965.1 ATP synthase F1 subunit delta [Mycoplasma nasistruthionis]
MYYKRNVSAYAVAIYDLVKENDKFNEIQPEFEQVKNIITAHPELIDYLKNDLISEQERLKTVDLVFQGLDTIILNTIKVVVLRKMTPFLKKIIVEYLKLANNELKVRFVRVLSAFPLDSDQLDNIREKLQKVTRRTVVLKNEIDSTLISGIKIVSKTEVLEMNLQNDLNKIKNEFIIKKEVL